MDSIILRHRPKTFEDVFGNREVVQALESALARDGRAHAYLLSGPSGCGKTTLARIIARTIDADVLEIDAGATNGVESIRALTEHARHRSFSGTGKRLVLLNEVQALTRNSWNALLTIMEEPPEHLYFALTTTEKAKVPVAVVTRCYEVDLQSLTRREMEVYLMEICDKEDWKPNGDIFNLLMDYANGSPRQALTLLDQVHDVTDIREAQRIINIHEESEVALIKICRSLLDGNGWTEVLEELGKIDDSAFANGTTLVCRYIMGAMRRADNEKRAKAAWILLDAFMQPSQTFDPRAAFYRAVGLILWG
jgi:DNA polymerase III gamma/tau subunit